MQQIVRDEDKFQLLVRAKIVNRRIQQTKPNRTVFTVQCAYIESPVDGIIIVLMWKLISHLKSEMKIVEHGKRM